MARFASLFVISCLVLPARALAESNPELALALSVCRDGAETAVAKAHRLRGDAAMQAASVLPNPSLVLEHQHTLSGPTERETVLGLSVPLGLGGRRGLLQDAADARRKQARAEARASLFEASLEFREAYARAVLAQARVGALTRNQALLDSLTTLLQKLERAGEAAAYDKLRQEAQARVHRQLLRTANARAVSARETLRAWLGTDAALNDADSVASVIAGDEVPRGAGVPAHESLQADALASELEARAARRRAVPDAALFAGYRAVTAGTETGHGVSLGLELPLTLFDHGQGESARAEADAQLLRAQAQRLKRRNAVAVRAGLAGLAQLRAALPEAHAAVRDVALAREKALQLYAAGEASITDLLDAFRAAEEAELLRLDLVQDVALTRLAVMRAAGTHFDVALDRECRDGNGQSRP